MSAQPSFFGRYSLGARLAMLVFGLIFLGLALYAIFFVHRYSQAAIVGTKYVELDKNMQALADGLTNYFNAAKMFLPMEMTPNGPTLDQERWGKKFPQLFATYAGQDPSDPFTKDGAEPLRYWTNNSGWTIWSMGPDGKYDLKDPKIYGDPSMDVLKKLPPYYWDPSNGVLSGGDIAKVYRPAPEE